MQNISFDVTALNEVSPLVGTPQEACMLQLVSAQGFVISIQPAETELQASPDEHAGPLMLEGDRAQLCVSNLANADH